MDTRPDVEISLPTGGLLYALAGAGGWALLGGLAFRTDPAAQLLFAAASPFVLGALGSVAVWKRIVAVVDGHLTVRTWPLPLGGYTLERSAIAKIEVDHWVESDQDRTFETARWGRDTTYFTVQVHTFDGAIYPITRRVQSAVYAKSVADRLRKALSL